MNFEAENERFQDDGKQIYEFGDEFLIVCPRCSSCAKVLPVENKEMKINQILFAPRKMVCPNCGHNELWKKTSIAVGAAFDWYFRRPLWLQIECCQNVLWAYNRRHLEFIENYVAAKIRQRAPRINKSVASRLPQWIKNAKNRDEILKCVARLRSKLNEQS